MDHRGLSNEERMKTVTFKKQKMSFQEKTALYDLKKAFGKATEPDDRPVYNKLSFKTKNNHVHSLEISQKAYTYETFPKSIKYLTWLEDLNLSWNHKLHYLPDEIGELHSLKKFNIEYSGLKKLPSTFGNLKKLKILSLNMNQLETLPESFGNLESLTELNIANNSLKKLPKTFCQLKNLRILILKSSRMPLLTDSICKLKKLERIKIGEYQVNHFPKTIAKKLKDQNVVIEYSERVWQGGPGGNYETEYNTL